MKNPPPDHQYSNIIDRLDLSDLRKDFLKSRWLDQLQWLEGRAIKERNRYNLLRLTTIVGGAIIPALVGINKGDAHWQEAVSWSALGVSQAVAICAAAEEFFAPGEKYKTYRNTAESLKTEAWEFFQLCGKYHQFETHTSAYSAFAEQVEQYIQKDVKDFMFHLQHSQQMKKLQHSQSGQNGIEISTAEKLNHKI
jgi:cytochrome c553